MIKISYQGEKRTLKEWSKFFGIHYNTLYVRYRVGWDTQRMFTEPVDQRKSKKLRKLKTKEGEE